MKKLFTDDYLPKIFCFKGGTSLSKVYKLIERFSEDIDLILDWRTVTDEDVYKPSKNKQSKFNESLLGQTEVFVKNEISPKLAKLLEGICDISIDEDERTSLNIKFPTSIDDKYIRPYIKLEIGPLAAWNPNDIFELNSYLAEINPSLNIKSLKLPVIKAERTFWEKATILHREHFRPEATKTPIRYSRHYYDLYKLSQSKIKDNALNDLELLKEVVDFKSTFYSCNWAKYELAKPSTFALLPNPRNIEILQKDYEQMKSMIYGEYPSWSEIINELSQLEKEINALPAKKRASQ
ncbi:MAG: nucleotidyl transferase AbiEii/AbiGii toxin family protein [Opitutales bacterium]